MSDGVPQLRDQAVIELLREDLEQLGDGVLRTDVSAAAMTRWPDRVIQRLRREGFVIEDRGDRFRLYSEPASTDTPVAHGGQSVAPRGGAGVSVDAAPRLFDPASTAVSGPGGCSLSPGMGPGAAVGAGRRRPLREAA